MGGQGHPTPIHTPSPSHIHKQHQIAHFCTFRLVHTDGWTDGRTDKQMDGWMDRQADGQKDGRMDGWMDKMDGRRDGWTMPLIELRVFN